MKNLRLIIAGAKYYSPEDKAVLIPHFTGEYNMVDCDRYLTEEEVIEIYGEDSTIDFENLIEHEEVDYIYAESDVFEPTEKWVLLSDLSKLRYDGD